VRVYAVTVFWHCFVYCTELANSNNPEQEDTLPNNNECKADSNCNANLQAVNNAEDMDENKNPSSRGDQFIMNYLADALHTLAAFHYCH